MSEEMCWFVLAWEAKEQKLVEFTQFGPGAEVQARRFLHDRERDDLRAGRFETRTQILLHARSIEDLKKTHGRYFE